MQTTHIPFALLISHSLIRNRDTNIGNCIANLIFSQKVQGADDLDVPAGQVLLDAVVDEAGHEDLARRLGKPAATLGREAIRPQ